MRKLALLATLLAACAPTPDDFQPGALGGGSADEFTRAAVVLGTLLPGDGIVVDGSPGFVDDLPEEAQTGESCDAPEAWRCAFSARFQTAVSQVCRDGEWLNFHLTPQDCGACAAGNKDGCRQNPDAVNAGYEVPAGAGGVLEAHFESDEDAVLVAYGPKRGETWADAEPITWVRSGSATLSVPLQETGLYLLLVRRFDSEALPESYSLFIDCEGGECGTGQRYDVGFLDGLDAAPIHAQPDRSSEVIAELANGEPNLAVTGNHAGQGNDLWVELATGGWIERRYLAESASGDDTCEALGHPGAPVTQTITRFEDALARRDGAALASVVSPIHGLSISYTAHERAHSYDRVAAANLFTDPEPKLWGHLEDDSQLLGSFAEVMLPLIDGVPSPSNEIRCDDVADPVKAVHTRFWAPDFDALSQVSYFEPGTQANAGLDWRSVQVGIEYIQGQAFIASITFTEWAP